MSEIQFIKAPNSLRKVKVGHGEARLDPVLIQRAEAAVQALRQENPEWAREEFTAMQKALGQLEPNGENRLALRDLQQNAIDVKAQAAGFGYPLIGDVAALLIEYLHDVRSVTADDISVIETTVSAMRAIYAEKRTGDGGAMGVELIDSLKSLMREGPLPPSS